MILFFYRRMTLKVEWRNESKISVNGQKIGMSEGQTPKGVKNDR